MRNELPDFCYSTLQQTGELIVIKKGESGYFHTDFNTDDRLKNVEIAEFMNARNGVSPMQKEAMVCGSMLGWQSAGADPQRYLDTATLQKTENIKGHIKEPILSIYHPVQGELYEYHIAGKSMQYLSLWALHPKYIGREIAFTLLLDVVAGNPLLQVRAVKQPNGSYTIVPEKESTCMEQERFGAYAVTAKVRLGDTEYIMGEGRQTTYPYAVWQKNVKTKETYNFAYYSSNIESTLLDFEERIGLDYAERQQKKIHKKQRQAEKGR